MTKIVMIVGSLREQSLNRQLAAEIEKLIGRRADVSYLDFADIPFMNQDLENPVLPSVAQARKAVLAADGLWIVSPEYNYNIPGPLKNLLDWLSRPADPLDRHSASVLREKRVTLAGAAGKSGAAGVRAQLANLLKILGCELVGGEGTGVILDAEAFSSSKLTLTAEEIAAFAAQTDAFIEALN